MENRARPTGGRLVRAAQLAALFWAGAVPAAAGAAAPDSVRRLDPANATWHVGLAELWGKNDRGQARDLDIYAVFVGGKWTCALGSARYFNTSMHFIERADVKLAGDRLSGKVEGIITADAWVPKDGQPIDLAAEFDGHLKEEGGGLRLSGTYRATLGGQTVNGRLIGGAGPTEPGFEDSTWSFSMNPVVPPEEPDCEMLRMALGVAEGKVQWGQVGLTWRGEGARMSPFDTSGLRLEGSVISGRLAVPHRAVDVAGDPDGRCEIDLTAIRVQGLTGGKATLAGAGGAGPRRAYGRGTARRGGGKVEGDAPRPLWRHELDTAPWFAPVAGFQPPAPGEHPRLLFRRADIPALRQKAQTPEGKAILARLRVLLNGGDGQSLPTVFNTTPPHNYAKSPDFAPGVFTTWHAEGYGLLYVVTGDPRYADLARQAAQLAFDGRIDRDNRYAWIAPGTGLRAGSILQGIATAYDLCYDAWPDDFRRKVAREIQDYDKTDPEGGTRISLKYLAGRTRYPPASNHYGAHMGAGTAVLGILGDPGTDTAVLTRRLAEFEHNVPRILSHGFGDHGFYAEGHHPSRVSANDGLLEFLMALRSAGGRDYIAPRPNAQWITLRWLMEVVPRGGKPCLYHHGPYGGDELDGAGKSHSGEVAYGFGTIDEKYKPAWLWFYDNWIRPVRPNYGANTYPHRAVCAFVHWPAGVQPVNPGEALPKAAADTIHGYFMSRNRWQDEKDIVVTLLLQTGPQGYHRLKTAGVLSVMGLGSASSFNTGLGGADPTYYRTAEDGSYLLSVVKSGNVSALAVDLSGASGAPLLLVGVGPDFNPKLKPVKGGATLVSVAVKAGGKEFTVLTLQEGEAPPCRAEGDAVVVGKQTIRFDGRRLALGTIR